MGIELYLKAQICISSTVSATCALISIFKGDESKIFKDYSV